MTNFIGRVTGSAALIFFSAVSAAAQQAQLETNAQASALVQGACVDAVDGSTITLDWNPGFGGNANVAGVSSASLTFARPGGSRNDGHILLNTRPSRQLGWTFTGETITALGNGYYHFTFRVDAHAALAGEYRLIHATMDPITTAGDTEATPQSANDPAKAYFCVNLASAPARLGRTRN